MIASSTAHRILIVDDEVSIRNMLTLSLEGAGHKVWTAADGAHALLLAREKSPDLILLDLGLPDINGREVLKQLRHSTLVPVIILTVNDNEATKVALLDAGADDYLTKPFSLPELMARVRVALRHRPIEVIPIYKAENLEVDLNKRQVTVRGRSVRLTATEFELLAQLIKHQGQVVSQRDLLTEVWGINAVDQGHYLRIYIGQLRKKIEVEPSDPKHILTEPGVGYWIR